MVTPAEPFELIVLDSAIARLTVGPSGGGPDLRWITRVTSSEPPIHVVNGAGVAHRLSQPWAPDEGMTLETIEAGDVAWASRSKLPEAIEWSYMEWAEGSRAERGGALLASLPDGDYLLVRTKLPQRAGAQLLLGNERVPSPPNALELVDEAPFYAAAIGARSDAPPSGATPLVGLAVLDYVGDAIIDGALFLEIVRSAAEQAAGAATSGDASADAVVVIPTGGELVIDVLEGFSADSARAAKERWRTTRAPALARLLAWGAR